MNPENIPEKTPTVSEISVGILKISVGISEISVGVFRGIIRNIIFKIEKT